MKDLPLSINSDPSPDMPVDDAAEPVAEPAVDPLLLLRAFISMRVLKGFWACATAATNTTSDRIKTHFMFDICVYPCSRSPCLNRVGLAVVSEYHLAFK